MQRLIFLVASISAMAGSAYLAWLARAEQPEAFAAKAASHDFGRLRQGDVVEHDFELVNNFRVPVTIHSVTETCSCAHVHWPRTPVAPGGSALVNVGWKVGARRKKSGEVVTVFFSTGDGERERLPLEMRADVIPDMDYEPERAEFHSDVDRVKIEFRPNGDPACRVTGIWSTRRAFAVKLSPDARVADVSFDRSLWDGTSNDAKLTAVTTSRHEPYLWIPLWVENMP